MKDYTFGEHIYELRKERGLTQGDIANYLGISDKAISKWENGTAKPTISNLTKLAELMDIPLENLEIIQKSINKLKKENEKLKRDLEILGYWIEKEKYVCC